MSYYNAKPQAVNFKTAAEQARTLINSWVENETESKYHCEGFLLVSLSNHLYFHIYCSCCQGSI